MELLYAHPWWTCIFMIIASIGISLIVNSVDVAIKVFHIRKDR